MFIVVIFLYKDRSNQKRPAGVQRGGEKKDPEFRNPYNSFYAFSPFPERISAKVFLEPLPNLFHPIPPINETQNSPLSRNGRQIP